MWHIWLIAAGVFLIAEIITTGFLIFWLSIGALFAMIVSFFIKNIIIQTSVFVISSAILILATKPLINKIPVKKVATNYCSLKGKKAIVTQDIDSINGTGQVKIAGELWSAKSENDINIPKGTEVTVLNVEGVKAIVEPFRISQTIDK